MPRKNNTPKHLPFQPRSATAPLKKRFVSKQAALRAMTELQKYYLDFRVTVYQSPVDGGWYFTTLKDSE